MIETEYHSIPDYLYEEIETEANELGLSIDYYLMEFCQVNDTTIST